MAASAAPVPRPVALRHPVGVLRVERHRPHEILAKPNPESSGQAEIRAANRHGRCNWRDPAMVCPSRSPLETDDPFDNRSGELFYGRIGCRRIPGSREMTRTSTSSRRWIAWAWATIGGCLSVLGTGLASAQTSGAPAASGPLPGQAPAAVTSREGQLESMVRELQVMIRAGAEREARLERRLQRLEEMQTRSTTGPTPGTPSANPPEPPGPSVSTTLGPAPGAGAEAGPSVSATPSGGAVGPRADAPGRRGPGHRRTPCSVARPPTAVPSADPPAAGTTCPRPRGDSIPRRSSGRASRSSPRIANTSSSSTISPRWRVASSAREARSRSTARS